jgi:RHS repeat-associated protein
MARKKGIEVIAENNYYAFGLQHKGYNNIINGGNALAQQYKYNGIGHEDALGFDMYEMGARQYDPAIARWVVIDPVVHYSLSPYNAFDNNPVYWADPSGADAIIVDNGLVVAATGADAVALHNAVLTLLNTGSATFTPAGELIEAVSRPVDNADLSNGRGGRSGFGSELLAVIGFALEVGVKSYTDNKEITTLIYKYKENGKDRWGYLDPIAGTSSFVMDSAIRDHFSPLIEQIEKQGGTIVADVHTHGAGVDGKDMAFIADNNRFTRGYGTRDDPQGDLEYYQNIVKGGNLLNKKIVGYLVSPHGFIFKYDPYVVYGSSTKRKYNGVERYPYDIPQNLGGIAIPRDPRINNAIPYPVNNYGYNPNNRP